MYIGNLTKGIIMTTRVTTTTRLALLLAGVLSVLSACNTVEGAGKDVKHGGQAIENSADRNK
jgi:entericidin B